MSEATALLSRYRAGLYNDVQAVDFTAEEIAAAAATAASEADRFDLLQLKSLYHYLHREFREALAAALEAFALRPHIDVINNIGILARQLNDRYHAIDFMLANEPRFADQFSFYGVLAHNHGAFGDAAGARRYGTRALQMKDAAYGAGHGPTALPPVPTFDTRRRERNIIAFTLFGSDPRYVQPLLVSAEVRQHLYPLWTMRVYVDGSVPAEVVNLLKTKACQVVAPQADGIPAKLWRFLVADDPEIDRFLIRDADSIINIRERVAVDQWIASGRHFHVMRDFYSHAELILSGMWGGVAGSLPPMRERIANWLKNRSRSLDNRPTLDQRFLGEMVWPIVKQSVLVHDSWFEFGDKIDFPAGSSPRSAG